MHTVRSKETQRDLLKKIIPCVIKCKSISNSLASNQGIVMASFVLEAIKNHPSPNMHTRDGICLKGLFNISIKSLTYGKCFSS